MDLSGENDGKYTIYDSKDIKYSIISFTLMILFIFLDAQTTKADMVSLLKEALKI